MQANPVPRGLLTRRQGGKKTSRTVPLVRLPRTLPRTLSPAEADRLVAALRTHRDRAMVLAMLALKLTATRRVSHVYDIAADPGAALLVGLTALPKATALTTYSYRLEHRKQAAFLTAVAVGPPSGAVVLTGP